MARKSRSHAAKAKPTREKPPRPRRARRAEREVRSEHDPEVEAMEELVFAMAEVLTCPILVAQDLAEYCENTADEVRSRIRVAALAAAVHARPGVIETALANALDQFAATARRHVNELAELARRFAELDDHEVEHGHVEADDLPLPQLAMAMFGEPPSEADAAAGE